MTVEAVPLIYLSGGKLVLATSRLCGSVLVTLLQNGYQNVRIGAKKDDQNDSGIQICHMRIDLNT